MKIKNSIINLIILIAIISGIAFLFTMKSDSPKITKYKYLDAAECLKEAKIENLPKEIIDEMKKTATPLLSRIVSSNKMYKYKDAFIMHDCNYFPSVFVFGIVDYDVVALIYNIFYGDHIDKDVNHDHIRIYCNEMYNHLFEEFGWVQNLRRRFFATQKYDIMVPSIIKPIDLMIANQAQSLPLLVYCIYDNKYAHINFDDFLKQVKSYAIMDGIKPASQIFLVTGQKDINKLLDQENVEIYIHTMDEYMEKGYGSRLSKYVINEMLNQNIKVEWICDETNTASAMLAESLRLEETTPLNSLILNTEINAIK